MKRLDLIEMLNGVRGNPEVVITLDEGPNHYIVDSVHAVRLGKGAMVINVVHANKRGRADKDTGPEAA